MPEAPSTVTAASEGNRTLWVGGVEHWMNEAYLMQAFGAVGAVENIKIIRDFLRGSAVGYAFVQMVEHDDARHLLERLEGQPFQSADGSRFRVNWAMANGMGEGRGRGENLISLYVGNLDPSISEAQLLKLFSSRYASVVTAKVCTDPMVGASRGFGFVRFRDAREAEEAVQQMHGFLCGPKTLRVRYAEKKGGAHDGAGPGVPGGGHAPAPGRLAQGPWEQPPTAGPPGARHTVVIGGVYPGFSEYDLCCQFGIFGAVVRAFTAADGQQTVVEFRDRISAELAARHLQEQTGVPAMLGDRLAQLEACQAAAPPPQPSTEQAVNQLRSYLKEQLEVVTSQPSRQHFHILLQDPLFVRLFEGQLAAACGRREAEAEAAVRAEAGGFQGLPWLLRDTPELWAARPDVEGMNAAFLPGLGAARAFHRRHLGGLPASLRLPGVA